MKITQKTIILSAILMMFIQIKAYARTSPPASVNVIPAKVTTLTPVVWASGTIVSQNDSKISAEVSGRLINLSAVGTRVEKGNIIATLDDKYLKIQLREEQASVLNAETNLTFLDAEVRRKTSLVKKKLSALTDLDKTRSERDIAQGDVIAAKARLAKAEQDISYTQLRSPFDGLVVERIANLGEYLNKGSAIIRLVATDNSEAAIFAPVVSYQYLKNTKNLFVESPLGSGLAPIVTLVPVANFRSHLMEVRLDMSSFDWPIGLNIKAKVANAPSELVIAVPRDALILRREGVSVFRVNKDNIAEKIPVIIGVAVDDLVGISSVSTVNKIEENDSIIIRGAERLRAGQKVAIKNNNQSLVSGANNDALHEQGKKAR